MIPHSLRSPVAAVLATSLLLAACGDDDASSPSTGTSDPGTVTESTTDAGQGGTSADVPDPSGTSDVDARLACEQAVASLEGVSLTPPDEIAVQGALASGIGADGEPALLVAWTGASGRDSDLAPWFAPLDCRDGEWFGRPPARLNPGTDASEGQPKLAAHEDRVLAVWQRADGETNQVRMALHRPGGEPLDPEPRNLETSLRGLPVAGSTWQPSATALPDGRFAIAATFADPGWAAFRSYVAIVETDLSVHSAIPLYPPAPEPDDSGENGENGENGEAPDPVERRWHEAPVLAAADDGRLWVAWDDRSDDKDDVSVVLLTPDGEGGYAAGEPVRVLPEEENAVAAPALAIVDHPDGQRAWMAVSVFSGNAPAMLLDVTDPASIPEPIVVMPRERAFRTALAPAGDRVLVAWQARDAATSARGHLFAQWMRVSGDSLVRDGERIELNLRGRRTHLAYPLAMASHGDGVAIAHTSSSPDSGWRTHLHLLTP